MGGLGVFAPLRGRRRNNGGKSTPPCCAAGVGGIKNTRGVYLGINKNEEDGNKRPKDWLFFSCCNVPNVFGDERKGNTWRVASSTPSAPVLCFRDLVPSAYL